MMKKNILLAAAVVGMLFSNHLPEAQAKAGMQISARNGHSFVMDARPSFIMLPDQGFSVAVGCPYDVVFFDNHYYINQQGSWYRSSDFSGPWHVIREKKIPSRIRKYSLEDIRIFRDTESRRSGNRRALEQQHTGENKRRTLG